MTNELSLSEKRALAGKKGGRARHAHPVRPENLRTTRPIASLQRGRNDWYRFSNLTTDTATVDIYDEIGYFGVTAKDFIADLNDLRVSKIQLNINSHGGDVFDATAIYNALLKHPARVHVDIEGLAASAASFIAMAGDHVRIGMNAQFMIHDAWGISIGNAAEMRQTADLLDGLSDSIADTYAERAGGTKEQWRQAMQGESWYNGREAVAAGLADELIERDSDDEAKTFDLAVAESVYKYHGRNEAPEPYIPEDDEVPYVVPEQHVTAKAVATASTPVAVDEPKWQAPAWTRGGN